MRILSPLRGWGGEVRSSGVGLVSGFREDAWFGRDAASSFRFDSA
jgi:hypothetical protein